MPKFIGPYKVTKSHPEILRYTLDLPPELKAQRIVPLFHGSLLCQYHKSDDAVFPKREVCTFYDFGDAEDNEWLVDDIIAHKWEGNNISFLIQWNLGDTTRSRDVQELEIAKLRQLISPQYPPHNDHSR